MEIKPGTKIQKPAITQAECDAYSAVVDAIIAHNEAVAVGDALWAMDDRADAYVVVECGTKTDSANGPKPPRTLEEQIAALQAAQDDADALNVDQEYRLTLLELGLEPEE